MPGDNIGFEPQAPAGAVVLPDLSPSPADTYVNPSEIVVDSKGRVLSVIEGDGGGAVDLSQRIYSPVDRALAHNPTFLNVGSYTWGGQWSAWRPISVSGVRLRWVGTGGHANQTLTFKIKDIAGADVRTCDVEVTGVGTYTGIWGSAWTPVIGDRWYLCQIGGTGVTQLADPDQTATPGRTFALDGALHSYALHLYISGEDIPTVAQSGDLWVFEPVYTLI